MPDPLERAIFRLCATQLARDRSLKVRLAAALAYFLVFPFVFLFEREGRAATLLPFVFVWFCAIIPLTVLELLRISAVPDSAELFLFTPIDRTRLTPARRAQGGARLHRLPESSSTRWRSARGPRTEPSPRCGSAAPVLFLVHPMSMMPGWARRLRAAVAGAAHRGTLGASAGHVPRHGAAGSPVAPSSMIANEAVSCCPQWRRSPVIAVVAHFVLRRWIRGRSLNALKRSCAAGALHAPTPLILVPDP
jgi:hypothetical protein